MIDEYFEGIRCLLIDKGDTPKWMFTNVYEVNDSFVKEFFNFKIDKLDL